MSDRGPVFLFPGQGSQYVGMGKPFYEMYQEVRDLFGRAEETLDMDLKKLCFEGPEAELVLTHNVQPAITLINMACSVVLGLNGVKAAAAAGHSLGEYSALHLAGVIEEKAVFELVRLRGQLMQEAANEKPGAMAAILNLPVEKIDEVCGTCEIEMANFNSPDQTIVSGVEEDVLRAMEICTDAGARRCVRLNVSGPWHSRCMELARNKFEPELALHRFRQPRLPVVANVDGDYLTEADAARENLARQLCAPVRWQQSMERLIKDGYQTFIEVGPKKVLRGLMRQINRQVEVLNVEDPKSLEACLKKLAG